MPREVFIDGVSYPSVTSAANALGVNRNTLTSRLKANTDEPVNTESVNSKLVIMGETFNNATEAANYFGINRATFYSRLKAGFKGARLTCTKSFQHRGKPVIARGKSFSMIKDMLAHFGIEQSGYNRLINMGLSLIHISEPTRPY